MLHEALALAEDGGRPATVAKVCRELGFIEVQAGRPVSAGRWLHRATTLADADDERAAVLGVRGMALSDRAHYPAAMRLLTESTALARSCRDRRQAAWSLAILGRARLLRGELSEAAAATEDALALVGEERWVAFQPFPEALRGEIALRQGDADRADALLDHAFALGCRLGDPCWEALAARARGLVQEARGEHAAALASLHEAATRAVRVADPYVWVHAHCLDALAGLAVARGVAEAGGHVDELERVAARGDMRELVVRAALHRARLGDGGHVAIARLLAEGIDNPALHAEIRAAA